MKLDNVQIFSIHSKTVVFPKEGLARWVATLMLVKGLSVEDLVVAHAIIHSCLTDCSADFLDIWRFALYASKPV